MHPTDAGRSEHIRRDQYRTQSCPSCPSRWVYPEYASQGIRQFLEIGGEHSISIVAEASDGVEPINLIREQRPDVAVLDIQMPGQTGIEVMRTIRAERLPVGVLILTAFDDLPYGKAVLQAGANGYVLKNADASEIVDAAKAVHEGQSVLDPLRLFDASDRGQTPEPDWPGSWTTRRVDEAGWAALRSDLQAACDTAAARLQASDRWPEARVAAAMMLLAHCVYHVGQIRLLQTAVAL